MNGRRQYHRAQVWALAVLLGVIRVAGAGPDPAGDGAPELIALLGADEPVTRDLQKAFDSGFAAIRQNLEPLDTGVPYPEVAVNNLKTRFVSADALREEITAAYRRIFTGPELKEMLASPARRARLLQDQKAALFNQAITMFGKIWGQEAFKRELEEVVKTMIPGPVIPEVRVPLPIETIKAKTTVYMEIRGHQAYPIPVEALWPAAARKVKELLPAGTEEAAPLMLALSTNVLVVGAFDVDLTYYLLGQLAVRPHDAPDGCALDDLAAAGSDHCFLKMLDSINPENEQLYLALRGDESTYLQTLIDLAAQKGIAVTTHNYAVNETIKFSGLSWRAEGTTAGPRAKPSTTP